MQKAITDDKQLYRFADFGIQASKDGIAFTLKANMGTYPNRVPIIKDDFGIWTITPRECLALQGFPESYTFPDTVPKREQYKQAGDTVCKEIVYKILRTCNGANKHIINIDKENPAASLGVLMEIGATWITQKDH